jgi:hypothetical protein
MIKQINCIKIENIRWIKDRKFPFEDMYANKPHILVAPNWFWKSSITIGFKSLNKNKVVLDKKNFHENKEANKPKIWLIVTLEDNSKKEYIADENSNLISKELDVFVINNAIIPKAKGKSFRWFVSKEASLEIETIILIDKIHKKKEVKYTYNDFQKKLVTKKIKLPNLSKVLKNKDLMVKIWTNKDYKELVKSAQWKKKNMNIEIIYKTLNEFHTAKEVEDYIVALGDSNKNLLNFNIDFKTFITWTISDLFLCLLQLIDLNINQSDLFKDMISYYQYDLEKQTYIAIFDSIGSTRKQIKPKEHKWKYVLDFPDVRNISNGERDIFSFVGNLFKILGKIKKDNVILIIDEVFDYLDDANLIICQYYISKAIQESKLKNRKLFPLIMTHLNPGYFKSYVFSNQKVHFLKKDTAAIKFNLANIIKERWKDEVLVKYFFHYNPDSEKQSIDRAKDLNTFKEYNMYIEKELLSYCNDEIYDPLAVCCFLRFYIEKYLYTFLDVTQREQFLIINWTNKKMDYFKTLDKDIPDIFYLLGIIYNDGLHIDNRKERYRWLRSKLDNNIIKSIIKEIKEIVE